MKTVILEDYELELILEWAETSESALKRDLDDSWESDEGYSYFAENKLSETRKLKQKLQKIYNEQES